MPMDHCVEVQCEACVLILHVGKCAEDEHATIQPHERRAWACRRRRSLIYPEMNIRWPSAPGRHALQQYVDWSHRAAAPRCARRAAARRPCAHRIHLRRRWEAGEALRKGGIKLLEKLTQLRVEQVVDVQLGLTPSCASCGATTCDREQLPAWETGPA